MIQRIQTIYLSLIALISILLLTGSFLAFTEKTGSVLEVASGAIYRNTTGQNPEMVEKLLPLSVLIILIIVISLITIFLFKNRKIQLQLSLILITLVSLFVIALVHVSFSVVSKFSASIIPGIKMILPLLMLVFSILAFRGIKKDDRLVKSYDRLR